MPDLSIARRWKLPINKVESAIAQCSTFAKNSDGQNAVDQADIAKMLLAQAIEDHSELSSIRSTLRDIQLELAEVTRVAELASDDPYWWTKNHHPALVPNPGFLDISKSYWQVGRQYRQHCIDYLSGKQKGLWKALNETRLSCLGMREKVLTHLRETLKPLSLPQPEK